MAIFTITVDATNGVDTGLLFPGSGGIVDVRGRGTTGTIEGYIIYELAGPVALVSTM